MHTMRHRFTLLAAVLAAVAGMFALAGPASAAPTHTAAASAASQTTTGYTSVTVAPDVYALVASAGIMPKPTGGATAAPYKDTLRAKFPITGYRLHDLRIKHSGGLSLTKGSATINLRAFYIDLARLKVSGVVNGSATGSVGRVDLFTIGLSDRPDLGLVSLHLTDTAAGALNATFGVSAFAAGQTFGYATPNPFGKA